MQFRKSDFVRWKFVQKIQIDAKTECRSDHVCSIKKEVR